MVMDRTTWHYGQTPLNLLVLGVALGGGVVPLAWTMLPHQGNSSGAARILLVCRLVNARPSHRKGQVLEVSSGALPCPHQSTLDYQALAVCCHDP